MSLSAELWEAGGERVYGEILRHPFITGLTDGTLSHDAFRYFLVQDSHFLRSYSRALVLVAARATDTAETDMFARHSVEAVEVERDLHSGLLGTLGPIPDAGPGPVTTAYVSYMTAVCATGTYAEAIATVLPCYRIYRDVGRELMVRSSPDPLYKQWIETYASPEFDAVVESVLGVTDRLDVSPSERARCHEHFATTARYEWMFWDAAYHQLQWPV
jgi:thiaminase (transcriptional activator TenA)